VRTIELLSPAGDLNKLFTALRFGADAVYFAGKKFGLRAYATNFDEEGVAEAIRVCHEQKKKAYVTVNIFASNRDFGELSDYLVFLEKSGADGVIVSDPGVAALVKRATPGLDLHISTQANVTNKYAAAFWRDFGAKRIVLARELTLGEITEINEYLDGTAETEVFVHGAMCISYSGRCLLSTYLTDRDSNRGECVQACRWEYALAEKSRTERPLTISEDERGTYILNSKDMNTIGILDRILETGVSSLKIEGRMKSEYYVGCVTDAYRRGIDGVLLEKGVDPTLQEELEKVNHREYCTGFYLGKAEQCLTTSKPDNPYRFCAQVLGYDEDKKCLVIEQRNRFFAGDDLEVVSPLGHYNVKFDVLYDEEGNPISDCKIVQQKLFVPTDLKLGRYDIIRKKETVC